MSVCQRCQVHHATSQVAGLPMCGACAATMGHRYGTGALSDVTPLGIVAPPIGAQQLLHDDTPGQGSGSVIKDTASSVKKSASDIKTAAIILGVVTGGALIYILWKQSQTATRLQESAMQAFAPTVVHHVTHPVPGL